MNSPADEGLTGLLQWSDPVIFDRLRDAYGQRIGEMAVVWRLARLHSRVWRALIEGDMNKFETQRFLLVAALSEQGLDLDCLAEVDARTMQELVEIVVARFHRSQRLSTGYHLALLQLAGRLTPQQARAARGATSPRQYARCATRDRICADGIGSAAPRISRRDRSVSCA